MCTFRKKLTAEDVKNISAILRDYRRNNPTMSNDTEAYKLSRILNSYGIKAESVSPSRP